MVAASPPPEGGLPSLPRGNERRYRRAGDLEIVRGIGAPRSLFLATR